MDERKPVSESDAVVHREKIKPNLTEDDAYDIMRVIYGLDGGAITKMNGYDDLNYHYVAPVRNSNAHIKTLWPDGYILKVINTRDSKNPDIQEAQTQFMIYLGKHGLTCSTPVKNKFGRYFSVEQLPITRRESNVKVRDHIVKLLEFRPGILLKHVSNSYSLYYQVGEIAAKLDIISQKFHHPAYDTHESIWHLSMLPKVKNYMTILESGDMKQLLETTMDEFDREVVPKMSHVDKQVIHGDLNSQNIVCEKVSGEWRVSSIIDFGDSHVSYPLYELAICMCYIMLDCKEKAMDHYVGAGHGLAGYVTAANLFTLDYVILKKCITARLCQAYVLGAYHSVLQPDNIYISENLQYYSQLLFDITRVETSTLEETWSNIIKSYETH